MYVNTLKELRDAARRVLGEAGKRWKRCRQFAPFSHSPELAVYGLQCMPLPAPKVLDVVVGIVFREGRVLVSQRRSDNSTLPDMWEFPGGKQEPGEPLEECLHREVDEELAVRVRAVCTLPAVEYDYAQVRVRLHPFICAHVSGEPRAIECQQFRWVAAHDLTSYAFPPANAQIIRAMFQWLELHGETVE